MRPHNYYLHSGNPATLVSNDKPPANTVADTTTVQFTALITAALPIVAIAVWAMVFTALTPAHFNHFFDFSLNFMFFFLPFQVINPMIGHLNFFLQYISTLNNGVVFLDLFLQLLDPILNQLSTAKTAEHCTDQ